MKSFEQTISRNVLVVFTAFASVFLLTFSTHSFAFPVSFSIPKFFTPPAQEKVKIVTEESLTIDIVKKVGPSVVTVVGVGRPSQTIGSGFIVSSDGLIVTSKHVISDSGASYKVITADNKKYSVSSVYKDSQNDIAILKINPSENSDKKLEPVVLGD